MRTHRLLQLSVTVAVSVILFASAVVSARADGSPSPAPGPRHERVTMQDGIELDGWVWLPDAVRRRPVSTVLVFSMYWGNLDPPGNSPSSPLVRAGDLQAPRTVVPAQRLVEKGYALAFFNVRGTGDSGGCYDFYGPQDAKDGAALVAWIAAQPWSDQRVGMAGLSHDASMAMQTATLAPGALKAVVAMSPVVDMFLFAGTPNGVLSAFYGTANFPANAAVGGPPPVYRSISGAPYTDPAWTAHWGGQAGQRFCDETEQSLAVSANDPYADQRDKAWWSERRFTDGLPNVRAAVLTSMGFADTSVQGFGIDAVGWDLLRAPKSMILGQWGHNPPPDSPASVGGIADLEAEDPPPDGKWDDLLVGWFDYFLRSTGPRPPSLGAIRYQTDDNRWHETRSWSSGGNEAVSFTDESRSFVSVAQWAGGAAAPHLCADDGRTSLFYSGDPLTAAAEVAGAGFAYLRISSTESAGEVGVQIVELAPDFSCETNPTAFKLVTWGAADLRFYDGSFDADPFPIDEPKDVRIDLESAAQAFEAGSRLAIVVNNGDPAYRGSQTNTPVITVLPESHVVLPVTRGTLGGTRPALGYPARPNLPPRVTR